MAQQSSMLAVFSPSVAKCPAGLPGPSVSRQSMGLRGDEVLKMFGAAANNDTISIHFGDAVSLRYNNACGQRQFAAFDDIFCIFRGSLHNLSQLRQTYGLCRSRMCEATLVIEMYKALRDRAPFPVSQAISEFQGNFSFVLYDNRDKAVLISMDGAGKLPLYWGTCQDGTVALSDDVDILRKGCNTSFAPFPAGCFFSTPSGLKSFEHPALALKAVPHVDAATGKVCGSCFEVDPMNRLEQQFMQVGSCHDLHAL